MCTLFEGGRDLKKCVFYTLVKMLIFPEGPLDIDKCLRCFTFGINIHKSQSRVLTNS